MPLPVGSAALVGNGAPPNPAYLIRFPQDTWEQLENAIKSGGQLSLCLDGGMSLRIPGVPPCPLESNTTGSPFELHLLSSSALTPVGLAAHRLSVPFSSTNTSNAANKMRAQNEAIDREKKERAERVAGVAAPKKTTAIQRVAATGQMSRSQSTPPAGAPAVPTIALKTRVVQLLALGAITVAGIVDRIKDSEHDVMRVVNVVGQKQGSNPPTYTLLPSQYSKVKISDWKYTHGERREVIRLAREAFDELGLPSDAEERIELDKKEMEGASTSGSTSSASSERNHPQAPVSVPQPVARPAPPKPTKKTATGGPPLTKASKQIAIFKAESQKRSSSLPSSKPPEGMASPRPSVKSLGDGVKVGSKGKEAEKEKENGKRKREEEAPARKKRMASPAFTSSSSEAEDRGRKPTKKNGASTAVVSPMPTPAKPISKAKPPQPPRDPESLRERYEELFPAYQQLATKLVELHHRCSEGEEGGEEEGEVVDKVELEKMVGKWQKWHKELSEIRSWFEG
ncbi:hypothetical protein P7C73_g3552, partial [Tremellales sp. Uapishka_1]